jgi:hypothetical protein
VGSTPVTRDTDAAITTELAGSGVIHQRLLDPGYAAAGGNSYTRPVPDLAVAGRPVPELAVDLLVPSLDGRFRPPMPHVGMSRTRRAKLGAPPGRNQPIAAGFRR